MWSLVVKNNTGAPLSWLSEVSFGISEKATEILSTVVFMQQLITFVMIINDLCLE